MKTALLAVLAAALFLNFLAERAYAQDAAAVPIYSAVTNSGNTQITITGGNFSPTGSAPGVSLGGVNLTLLSFANNSAVATLPANPQGC
jgi:hypothetical protein